MEINITLTAKHFRNATRFSDPMNCPLSIALKEEFKTDKVIVGGNCAIINNQYFTTDWSAYKNGKSINDMIVDAKKKRGVGEHSVKLNIEIHNALIAGLTNLN